MAKKYKLPILWSVDCDPYTIIEMVNDERISALIEWGKFRCRIGSFIRITEPRAYVVSPSEPHGVISNIYDDESGWYGDVTIPDINGWPEFVDNMNAAVLHPMIKRCESQYNIILFNIIERSELMSDRVYNGKVLPESLQEPEKLTLVEGENTGEPRKVPDEMLKFKGKTVDPFKVPDPTAHDVALAVKGAMSKWDKQFRDEVKSHNQPEQIKKLILDLTAEYVKGMTEMVDKAVAELGVTDNNECS